MKIRLKRGYRDSQPCCCAKPEKTKHLDWRASKTLKEVEAFVWGPQWLSTGSLHREEDGKVVKEEEETVYTIDLSTKEDYETFFKNHPLPMKIEDEPEYPDCPRVIKLDE